MKKHIFIFRHGETDWNKESRIQGQKDIPLNAQGKQQAVELAELLKEHKLEHIVSSDSMRTRETVHPLVTAHNISVSYHAELREIAAGIYEGRTHLDIVNEHLWHVVKNNPNPIYHTLQLPGGESRAQVEQRMTTFIQTFLETTPHLKIGVATHGFSMKLFLMAIDSSRLFELEHAIPNTHVIHLAYDVKNKTWEIIDGAKQLPKIKAVI